jgi:hypothetical protein
MRSLVMFFVPSLRSDFFSFVWVVATASFDGDAALALFSVVSLALLRSFKLNTAFDFDACQIIWSRFFKDIQTLNMSGYYIGSHLQTY